MEAHEIKVFNVVYLVTLHASKRMLEKFISDEMVTATLEQGTIIREQANGVELYEHQVYEPESETMVTVRVVVNSDNKRIVTVYDDTDNDDE